MRKFRKVEPRERVRERARARERERQRERERERERGGEREKRECEGVWDRKANKQRVGLHVSGVSCCSTGFYG